MRVCWNAVIAIAPLLASACKGEAPRAAERSSAPSAASERDAPAASAIATRCDLPDVPLRRPAPARLIAIGDLHGDADAARIVLRLAGAIDGHDAWIGGALVVVQLGDVLDRGDGEQDILDLFATLEPQARAAGGALLPLLGNHELMNAAGDFRYVTPGGFADFDDAPGVAASPADVHDVPAQARARAEALFPRGPYAMRLTGHDVVMIVGDTLFAHGGVEPAWSTHLDELNRGARCWLAGQGPLPDALTAEHGPAWSRAFAGDDVDCAAVEATLRATRTRRMVIAHTVQPHGISSACDDRVWRIDVGLAKLYGGPRQVLEIQGDTVRALTASP